MRGVLSDFSADDAMSLAASVAFYTALSFAPLVLLVVTIGGFLGDREKNDLVEMFAAQLGPAAAKTADTVVETAQAQTPRGEWWRIAASSAGLLVTASGVFAQLQASLNRVWDVQAKPGQGFWGFIRKRLLSMGMVLSILFVLLVSLVVSAIVGRYTSALTEALGWIGDTAAAVIVSTVAFALMFKVLPDVKIGWRDVWIGALITAGLFTAGKAGLAVYLDKGSVGASYGAAAGGLIALLVWVYYSCTILLLGAEITQRYARLHGRGLQPSEHAVRAE
ncbi:MAG TPA: YihY/virulence factor BrkB family protein [Phycisphaerales bacterium]|nr:YihY/virulence factor BrkB family protein [Phycisphaerales bacterium]